MLLSFSDKETQGDNLKALHDQQRAEEKASDKKEAEAEKKQQEFNERANEIISAYNKLQTEKSKFEDRMAEKQGELDALLIENEEKAACVPEETAPCDPVDEAGEQLLRDYVDVY
jgi:hypothetical protein